MSTSFDFEPEPLFEEDGASASHASLPEEDHRLRLAGEVLRQVKETIQSVIDILDVGDGAEARQALISMLTKTEEVEQVERLKAQKVVEGVFDGEQMIGSDGKTYSVPSNYASKSRLVEGDIMKLTVRKDGTFLYKQIGPMERRRVVARLAWDSSSSSFVALSGDHVWKVLTASVTFFKGQEGDKVVLLIPKHNPSVWAAVENIVKD